MLIDTLECCLGVKLRAKALVAFRRSKNETVRKFFIEPINDKRPARWLT